MKVIDWLLTGDPVIVRLTNKYLLGIDEISKDDGFIKRYLDLFDENENMWGHGIYSPKWISTHYTLLELCDMEINSNNPIYKKAVLHLVKDMWPKDGKVNKYRHQDMCVVAMMMRMLAYSDPSHGKIEEMLTYILKHQLPDGGWNCSWERDKTLKSSLHTTLSVLEAMQMLVDKGYQKQNLLDKIQEGVSFIYKKRFFRKETNNEVIYPDFQSHHYPPRWKYDYFRAMFFLAKAHYPYNQHMDEPLSMIKHEMNQGYLTPGKKYTGKFHFTLESKKSRFNTLRAMIILNEYDQSFYQEIIKKDFEY
jgi:hypothetical protein